MTCSTPKHAAGGCTGRADQQRTRTRLPLRPTTDHHVSRARQTHRRVAGQAQYRATGPTTGRLSRPSNRIWPVRERKRYAMGLSKRAFLKRGFAALTLTLAACTGPASVLQTAAAPAASFARTLSDSPTDLPP